MGGEPGFLAALREFGGFPPNFRRNLPVSGEFSPLRGARPAGGAWPGAVCSRSFARRTAARQASGPRRAVHGPRAAGALRNHQPPPNVSGWPGTRSPQLPQLEFNLKKKKGVEFHRDEHSDVHLSRSPVSAGEEEPGGGGRAAKRRQGGSRPPFFGRPAPRAPRMRWRRRSRCTAGARGSCEERTRSPKPRGSPPSLALDDFRAGFEGGKRHGRSTQGCPERSQEPF